MQILTKKKAAELDALVDQLKRFNEVGLTWIVEMQKIAASLDARMSALEAFQQASALREEIEKGS